jgi:predicted AAA+ superfamily ATPase
MKSKISQLIDDFHKRDIPRQIPRDQNFQTVQGSAKAIIGMRRTGKILCCYQKMSELLSKGIQKEEILYINFEDDRLFEFEKKNFQEILDVYYDKYPKHRNLQCYFFFDEIVRIDQWEPFIRQLSDRENVQVYFTGSSSRPLGKEIDTTLKGHAIKVEVFPLDFKEFLKYHKIVDKIPTVFDMHTSVKLRQSIKDYVEIGGFPEVQLLDRHARVKILQSYIDSIILKDIVERHNVSNIKTLKHLVRAIMNSTGEKFSINKFYKAMKALSIRCTKNSLYEYLDHLSDAFVFFKVPLHSNSEKARRSNPPQIYTIDTGLLKAMTFRTASNYNALLKNLVFMHLRRNDYDIKYAKTKQGQEIDFIAQKKTTQKNQLIQVCWDINNMRTLKRELKHLKSAMQEHKVPKATIVSWDDEIDLYNEITITPIWKWLLN